ncbi:hypothetical protein CEXT_230811 [Caerostris extrusa]|uniref:BTB domain-containing protein n=1 Tax=Caerostris extrusa TaxID=172846 RepID=A0AAV4RNJ4_CAEEX|nr:hypothetical protein CEXT_230811 [Caerostris extrusa]
MKLRWYGEKKSSLNINLQVCIVPIAIESVFKDSNSLSKDFRLLYEDPLLSDMKLKTETKTFDVLAAVLSARSEVFKIMFNIEMTEKLNRNVYISDVDD